MPSTIRPSAPVAISRYVLAEERQVITVRRHPFMISPAASEAAGSLAMALLLNGSIASSLLLKLVIFVPTVFLWARLWYVVASWAASFVVITSNRFMFVYGVFTKKVNAIALSQLGDVGLERSLPARIFGYGTLTGNAGGPGRVLAAYMPYPEQIYLELLGLITPSRDADMPD